MDDNWELLIFTSHARMNLIAMMLSLMGACEACPSHFKYIQ